MCNDIRGAIVITGVQWESPFPMAHSRQWGQAPLGRWRCPTELQPPPPQLLAKGKILPPGFPAQCWDEGGEGAIGLRQRLCLSFPCKWMAGALVKAVACSVDDPDPPSHQGCAIVWALQGPDLLSDLLVCMINPCLHSCRDGFNEDN